MILDQVDYRKEYGVIWAGFEGSLDVQRTRGYSEAILTSAVDHHCKKVLIDARGAKLTGYGLADLEIPTRLFLLGLDRTLHRAILVDDEPGDFTIYETVARKLGFNARVFRDVESALAWLKEQGITYAPRGSLASFPDIPELSAVRP